MEDAPRDAQEALDFVAGAFPEDFELQPYLSPQAWSGLYEITDNEEPHRDKSTRKDLKCNLEKESLVNLVACAERLSGNEKPVHLSLHGTVSF